MIFGIALKAHPQRGGSYSRVCAMWSVTFLHPVLHIHLMCNAGQALEFGSTGDMGSLTPARIFLQVMSRIYPACHKRSHLPST